MLTRIAAERRLRSMESMNETPLPELDEAPTQVASPACPECKATYTMNDLVFGHPCHEGEKEVN